MPLKNNDTPDTDNQSLTDREIEVLQLLADGKCNKQAAEILNVSEDTIDKRSRSLVAKLEARNMKHAIAIGIRKKIMR